MFCTQMGSDTFWMPANLDCRCEPVKCPLKDTFQSHTARMIPKWDCDEVDGFVPFGGKCVPLCPQREIEVIPICENGKSELTCGEDSWEQAGVGNMGSEISDLYQ